MTTKTKTTRDAKQALDLQYVDPRSLIPDPRNPRIITADAKKKLRRAIEELGFSQPLLARTEDRMVVGGHQRLEVALEMGLDEVPVVFRAGLTDAQVGALNIALNNPELQGQFDDQRLAALLTEIDDAGFDASLSGFTGAALETAMAWEPPMDIVPEYDGHKNSPALAIDRFIVPMTEQENADLVRELKRYVAEKGVLFGFVGSVLRRAGVGPSDALEALDSSLGFGKAAS